MYTTTVRSTRSTRRLGNLACSIAASHEKFRAPTGTWYLASRTDQRVLIFCQAARIHGKVGTQARKDMEGTRARARSPKGGNAGRAHHPRYSVVRTPYQTPKPHRHTLQYIPPIHPPCCTSRCPPKYLYPLGYSLLPTPYFVGPLSVSEGRGTSKEGLTERERESARKCEKAPHHLFFLRYTTIYSVRLGRHQRELVSQISPGGSSDPIAQHKSQWRQEYRCDQRICA